MAERLSYLNIKAIFNKNFKWRVISESILKGMGINSGKEQLEGIFIVVSKANLKSY